MLRRLFALAVLLIVVYVAMRARQGDFGMLSPAAFICAVVFAIVALAGVVFRLPLARSYPDSGFGMSKPVGVGIGNFGVLLFAAAPVLIAAKGVSTGVLPAFGSGPDLTFASSPAAFLGALFVWIAAGLAIFWLFIKVRQSNRGLAANEDEA